MLVDLDKQVGIYDQDAPFTALIYSQLSREIWIQLARPRHTTNICAFE
jgi:hypothetical protein